jgi:RimJ/RimL family protein N-acetyltransferase
VVTEAAGAVVDRFFRRRPEEALFSGAFADNAGSLRIQEKLGFRILKCSDLFSMARNAMVPHLETRLTAEDFRRP